MEQTGILLLSHSDRLTNLRLCAVNYLTKRYAKPNRLQTLPPFEQLPPEKKFRNYSGSLSFFRLEWANAGVRFVHLGNIRAEHKMQHAVQIAEDTVLVGYESYVEEWQFGKPLVEYERITSRDHEITRRYEHPHFPGLHTIFPLGDDRVIVSCSAADAALVLDLRSGRIACTLRMPADLYGRNYDLTPERDLREHFISNDCQTTHINSAAPLPDGRHIVVSTLIQGAIGLFDLRDGSYREITRGYVGCHGARVSSDGIIYFADSVTGSLMFLSEDGRLPRRFAVDSRWLHDVQQIRANLYAFTLADKNELQVYDIATEELIFRRQFRTCRLLGKHERLLRFRQYIPGWYGDSTQFLSYRPALSTVEKRSLPSQHGHSAQVLNVGR